MNSPFSFGFALLFPWISCSKNFFLSRNEGKSSSAAVAGFVGSVVVGTVVVGTAGGVVVDGVEVM